MARAATTLLNEFRSGALGPMSLETVEQIAALLSEPRTDIVTR
jgi:hypothetical protein